MGKRLILILALAFVLGISFAAYAEVQNVKVSGDIQIMGVYRNNFDLAKSSSEPLGDNITTTYRDEERDLLSITRVRIDADLTDNVTATVRLLNERNWNGESTTAVENNRNIGWSTANANVNDEDQINLDLAYVTLKEFLYSPLSLKAGRQELHFGNDFIIGDPDTNGAALKSPLAEGDLSARKSFDAVRATLDYNPLVVDVIYAKIAEKNTVFNDDTTLSGLNAAYTLNKNTTLEGYFFSKIKGTNAAGVSHVDNATWNAATARIKEKADKVFTVGGRVVNKTLKNLTIDAQSAVQFGTYNPLYDVNARYDIGVSPRTQPIDERYAQTVPRRAWAAEVIATYDLKDIAKIAKYSPSVSGVYVYLSGEKRDKLGKKAYRGWDAMYENQTFGHILNAMMGFSNCTLTGVSVRAKPVEDVTAKLDYVRGWFNKRYPDGETQIASILSGVPSARQFYMNKNKYLGQEFDLNLTYDYTEDVQFALLGGVFLPGKSINKDKRNNPVTVPQRAAATELIGSMKVTF